MERQKNGKDFYELLKYNYYILFKLVTLLASDKWIGSGDLGVCFVWTNNCSKVLKPSRIFEKLC